MIPTMLRFLLLGAVFTPGWTASYVLGASLDQSVGSSGLEDFDSIHNGEVSSARLPEQESTNLELEVRNRIILEKEKSQVFPIYRKFGYNNIENIRNPNSVLEKQNVGYPPYNPYGGVNGNFWPQTPMFPYPQRYTYPHNQVAYAGNGGSYGYSMGGYRPWFAGNNYPIQGGFPNVPAMEVNPELPIREGRSLKITDESTNEPQLLSTTTENISGNQPETEENQDNLRKNNKIVFKAKDSDLNFEQEAERKQIGEEDPISTTTEYAACTENEVLLKV